MKKVFIAKDGRVSFFKTPDTVATAKMHCEQRSKYAQAADMATYNACKPSDIEKRDFNWMHECKQSPYGGKLHYYFQEFKMIQQPA